MSAISTKYNMISGINNFTDWTIAELQRTFILYHILYRVKRDNNINKFYQHFNNSLSKL